MLFIPRYSLSFPDLSPVVEMLSDLLVLSAPLSLPSLYLAYRLHKKDYLGTVFNKQMAMVLVFAGEDINWTAVSSFG